MADDLPPPMTPADCDLRGYEFMPLFGHRLFGSDFDMKATDSEFRIALRLWWAAWQQCPAGSLPDDDAALCRLADLGRDQKSWKKVRNSVLYGFEKCSDGRLYHAVLCEEALHAWERRRKEKVRKANMRMARASNVPGSVPRDSMRTSHGLSQGLSAACPRPVPRSVPSDRTGQYRTEEEREESKQAAAGVRTQNLPTDPEPAPPVDPVPTTNRAKETGPSRGAPPKDWVHLSPTREVDQQGITRATVGGYYLDAVAEDVCSAAQINHAGWRGDWRPLIAWLKDGYEAPDVIVAIRKVAARHGYRAPASLAYFDQAVREHCRIKLAS